MKRLIVLLALVAIQSGCGTIINDYELDRLEKGCEPRKGIRYIIANGDFSFAMCQDGRKIYHRYMEDE